jgi:hypothetical protein
MKELKENKILVNLIMIFGTIIMFLLTFSIVLMITKVDNKKIDQDDEQEEIVEEELSIDSKIVKSLPTSVINELASKIYSDQKYLFYDNLDYYTKMSAALSFVDNSIYQEVDEDSTILNTEKYISSENGKTKYISSIYLIQALYQAFGSNSQDLNVNKSFDTTTQHYEYSSDTDGFTVYTKKDQDQIYSIDCIDTKAIKQVDIKLYRTCTVSNGKDSKVYDIIETYGIDDNSYYWNGYEVVM